MAAKTPIATLVTARAGALEASRRQLAEAKAEAMDAQATQDRAARAVQRHQEETRRGFRAQALGIESGTSSAGELSRCGDWTTKVAEDFRRLKGEHTKATLTAQAAEEQLQTAKRAWAKAETRLLALKRHVDRKRADARARRMESEDESAQEVWEARRRSGQGHDQSGANGN